MQIMNVKAQLTGSSIHMAQVDFLTENVFVNGVDTGTTIAVLSPHPDADTLIAQFDVDISNGSHLVIDISVFSGTSFAFSLTNTEDTMVVVKRTGQLDGGATKIREIVDTTAGSRTSGQLDGGTASIPTLDNQ